MQLFPAFFACKICYFKQSSTVNSTCEAYSHRPARWERRFLTGQSNAASGCELTIPTPATQHAGHSRRRQSVVNTRTHTAATSVSNYHHFTRIIRDNLCQPAPPDFVGATFYCLHALADGNQRIRIREKTLEFSSTVLSTLSPYLDDSNQHI